MRRFTVVGTAAVIACLASSPALSMAPSASKYLISLRLRDGGRDIGAPQLAVVAGKPARIAVGDPAGDHYSIGITATPAVGEAVALASSIDIVSAGVHHTAQPTVLARIGAPVAIDVGGESGAEPLHVDFTVTQAR